MKRIAILIFRYDAKQNMGRQVAEKELIHVHYTRQRNAEKTGKLNYLYSIININSKIYTIIFPALETTNLHAQHVHLFWRHIIMVDLKVAL